jgi:hypothetical protein
MNAVVHLNFSCFRSKMTGLWLTVLMLLFTGCSRLEAATGYCQDKFDVKRGEQNELNVPQGNQVARTISPVFFGFNMEWVDFQQDIWDSNSKTVKPGVIAWMKPFSGAPYRYPGGTGSNYLDWQETIGQVQDRPLRKHTDWLPAFSPNFGFDEYLSFVKEVNGSAWVVLNIYGEYSGESDKQVLAERAARWAEYAARKSVDGYPAVLRWELGNELDRGNTKWPPDKYVEVARQVSHAVKQKKPDAEFVGMLQDWPAQKKYSVNKYNQIVMNGLKGTTQDFAHHLYYEGLNWETVSQRMAVACNTVEFAKRENIKTRKLWITEHARNLHDGATVEERKRNWRKTANLESALIAAEAYIAATQLPEIESLFLHSFGTAHGPWPLFHGEKNGGLHPSTVYWGIRILRDSLLDVVLVSETQSRDDEKSLGGHDVRATVLTNSTRDRYTVWAVNLAGKSTPLKLNFPALKGKSPMLRHTFISDSNKEANNYISDSRVQPQHSENKVNFDLHGSTQVELPAYSVSSITFQVQ